MGSSLPSQISPHRAIDIPLRPSAETSQPKTDCDIPQYENDGPAREVESRLSPKSSAAREPGKRLQIPLSTSNRTQARSKPSAFASEKTLECNDSDVNYYHDDDGFEPSSPLEQCESDLFPSIGVSNMQQLRGPDVSRSTYSDIPSYPSPVDSGHASKRCRQISGFCGPWSKTIYSNARISYEALVEAYLGPSFRLMGLVRIESCYEVHAIEPLFASFDTYEARAYNILDLQSKDRKYRTRNFRRCASNRFSVQSLEQGKKRWIISKRATSSENTMKLSLPSHTANTDCQNISMTLADHGEKASISHSTLSVQKAPERQQQAITLKVTDPSPLSPANCGEEPLPPDPGCEENTSHSQSKPPKPKTAKKRERAREQQRHARQTKRMVRSYEEGTELTNWNCASRKCWEVRASLLEQRQPLESIVNELQAQITKLRMEETRYINTLLSTLKRSSGLGSKRLLPLDEDLCKAVSLVDQMDDGVLLAMQYMIGAY